MSAHTVPPARPRGFFHHGRTGRRVPWPIWGVVLVLGFEEVFDLFTIAAIPRAASGLAWRVMASIGLIRGWRWVYAVGLVGGSLQVLKFLGIDPLTALMNLVLVGLIAASRRYFFPGRDGSVMVGEAQPSTHVAEP